MRILVITNLYPPQELGGYGRCISDFVWGLLRLGHQVLVLASNAEYLAESTNVGPNDEPVDRSLLLKGSFQSGILLETNPSKISYIDRYNLGIISKFCRLGWDGCLLGNIDLLGISVVDILASFKIPVLHHLGFVAPPFAAHEYPSYPLYSVAAASRCVRDSLLNKGIPLKSPLIIYPGVRDDKFFYSTSGLSSSIRHSLTLHESGFPLGSRSNPLLLGYAGLIMSSKGVHTLIQAAIQLRSLGYYFHVNVAGSTFQEDYQEYLLSVLSAHSLLEDFFFVGQLSRDALIRFWSLQHLGVFPSIHPEAFGISAAEIMCSGLLLCSTGVGGASELFTHGINGLKFVPDNAQSLVDLIVYVLDNPHVLKRLPVVGHSHVSANFSVKHSACQIQDYFLSFE